MRSEGKECDGLALHGSGTSIDRVNGMFARISGRVGDERE